VGGGEAAADHAPAAQGHGPSAAGGAILDYPDRADEPALLELERSSVRLGGQAQQGHGQ
jgi:hypothetical protein